MLLVDKFIDGNVVVFRLRNGIKLCKVMHLPEVGIEELIIFLALLVINKNTEISLRGIQTAAKLTIASRKCEQVRLVKSCNQKTTIFRSDYLGGKHPKKFVFVTSKWSLTTEPI